MVNEGWFLGRLVFCRFGESPQQKQQKESETDVERLKNRTKPKLKRVKM